MVFTLKESSIVKSQKFIQQRGLTLMLTYRCNAQCQDCGTFSSPHDKNDISLEAALSVLDWAKDCRMSRVVFTGGEATLRWDDLIKCISHARTLGMATRLVTNGQWAATRKDAESGITELINAGLGEINFSTGDEHIRFIPLDHILNGIAASIRAHLITALMFEFRLESKVNELELLEKIQALASPKIIQEYFIFLRSPWMPIRPDDIERYPEGVYANKNNIALRQGCESALSDYTVQGSGRIAACCGLGMRSVPELQVGNVTMPAETDNPLSTAIREAENDLFLYAIHKIGPEKILAWAAGKDSSIVWENMYAHRCQACMRLYKDPRVKQVIVDHMQELIADVIYGGYVLRHFEKLVNETATSLDNGITHFV
jgi:hypothetical protein